MLTVPMLIRYHYLDYIKSRRVLENHPFLKRNRENWQRFYNYSITHLKIKRIESIEIGNHEIECWYFSPYPEAYQVSKLFICEFCLKYYRSAAELDRHSLICPHAHPPGVEIYRDGYLLMYEVDGNKEIEYCQNLCLMAKLFIEHKTIYYDTYPFFFYVLCEEDEEGSHIVYIWILFNTRLVTFLRTKILKKDTILLAFVVFPLFRGKDMANSWFPFLMNYQNWKAKLDLLRNL